jgi:phosphate transport system substrate-binding protein
MTKYVFPVLLVLLGACRQQGEEMPETATSGTLRIAYDESYLPIANQETAIFQYLYKNATVLETVLPQEMSHALFLKDSVKVIISSRMLNEEELKYLNSRKVYPKTYEFANDGLMILASHQSDDSCISLEKLKSILRGGITGYSVIVDQSAGASLQSLVNQLGLGKDSLKNIYASGSLSEVTEIVSGKENTIGVVGGAWLSDFESPKTKAIFEKLRLVKVSSTPKSIPYLPFQSELADSLYPLKRKIYLISRESKMGLANGFAAFLLGEKGQRVVLKAGLLPARMPGREVVLSKKRP